MILLNREGRGWKRSENDPTRKKQFWMNKQCKSDLFIFLNMCEIVVPFVWDSLLLLDCYKVWFIFQNSEN